MGLRLTWAADATAPGVASNEAPAGAPAIPRELTETDLQHVVGGLTRAWVDETVLPDERDLVPVDGR